MKTAIAVVFFIGLLVAGVCAALTVSAQPAAKQGKAVLIYNIRGSLPGYANPATGQAYFDDANLCIGARDDIKKNGSATYAECFITGWK